VGKMHAQAAMDVVWKAFANDRLGLAERVYQAVCDDNKPHVGQAGWSMSVYSGRATVTLLLPFADLETQEQLEELAGMIDAYFTEQYWLSSSIDVLTPSERKRLSLSNNEDDDDYVLFNFAFSVEKIEVFVPVAEEEEEEEAITGDGESGVIEVLSAYEGVFGRTWMTDKDARADATFRQDGLGTLAQLDSLNRHDGKLCLKVTDTFPLDEEDYPRSLGLFTCDMLPEIDAKARSVSLASHRATGKRNKSVFRAGDIITLYGGCLFDAKEFRTLTKRAHKEVPGYNQYYVLHRGDWVQDGWPLHQCVDKPISLFAAQEQQRLPISERPTYRFSPDALFGLSPTLQAQLLRHGIGCMVNHNATRPNAQFVCLLSTERHGRRNFCMAIEALRDIGVSTEIMCDYGKRYFDTTA
jgi:hypothetical protein